MQTDFDLFGASSDALTYAYPYMMIYLIGTLAINDRVGYESIYQCAGIFCDRYAFCCYRSIANLLLDPLFIFVLGFGVRGAAIATVLSQFLVSSLCTFFPYKKAELKVRFLAQEDEIAECIRTMRKNIVSLGTGRIYHAAYEQSGNDLL